MAFRLLYLTTQKPPATLTLCTRYKLVSTLIVRRNAQRQITITRRRPMDSQYSYIETYNRRLGGGGGGIS